MVSKQNHFSTGSFFHGKDSLNFGGIADLRCCAVAVYSPASKPKTGPLPLRCCCCQAPLSETSSSVSTEHVAVTFWGAASNHRQCLSNGRIIQTPSTTGAYCRMNRSPEAVFPSFGTVRLKEEEVTPGENKPVWT